MTANTSMKRKIFMVVVDDAKKEQRDAFTQSFKDTPNGFWHYTDKAWVITTRDTTMNVLTLRDKAAELMPEATILVVAVEPTVWASKATKEANEWLQQHMRSD